MLFGRKPKPPNMAAHIIEQYAKEIEKDPKSRNYLFSELFAALTFAPKPQEMRTIGEVAADLLRNKNAYEVANLMHYCYADPTSADPTQWHKHCTPRGCRALLICGAAHPNGYFRERCLRLLTGERNVLQFVLLRVNDWVPQVRKTAQEILIPLLKQSMQSGTDEILHAMPFFEHVQRGKRSDADTGFSKQRLDQALISYYAAHRNAVLHAPVTLRRLCYRVILRNAEQQHSELLLHFIAHERDGAQRSLLVRAYLRTMHVTQEQLASFMQDKYWRVRLDACEYRMKAQGAWDGLERLLLSKSYPIREFAAYYLEQNGFDSPGYCRGHLPDSILALCDLGTKADIPLIRPYLETHPQESLVALVRLGAEDSETLLWKYMHHENAKLAKTAYRLAASQPQFAPSQLLPEIESQTDPQLRWRLIRLLGNVGDWNIMPILIRLVRDYTHLRPDILCMIEGRSSFCTSITSELAQEIRDALDYAGELIPERIAEDLRFDVNRLVSP